MTRIDTDNGSLFTTEDTEITEVCTENSIIRVHLCNLWSELKTLC